MVKYVRLCRGLSDQGKLVPIDAVDGLIQPDGKDYYKSLFHYSESHLNQFNEKGSVAGITDVSTNNLYFDFDSEADVSKAQNDAIELAARLAAVGLKPDQINIFFSGSKGFSIEIESTSEFSPTDLKKICSIFGQGLATLDTQIYNASRIVRVPFTKHNKSGLFKTPLTINELSDLTVDQIKGLAATGQSSVEGFAPVADLPESMLQLKDKQLEIKIEYDPSELTDLRDLDFSKRPKGMSECRYALLNGFFRPGQRSKALMILAAHFRAQGFPKEVTYRLLKGARELNERRYPSTKDSDTLDKDYVWNNIIGQVYGINWKGATYSCKEEPVLNEICKAIGSTRCGISKRDAVVSIGDVSGLFKNYASNIDKNTIKTGIPSIDSQIRLQSNSHVVIAGCSGAGKTTVVLNILNNVSNAGSSALFCSMDMGAQLIYQKLAHKVTGMNDKELYKLYKENSPKIQEIDSKIAREFKNVHFDFRAGVEINEIRENVLNLKEKTGDSLKLVVLDFINRVRGPYADETANLAYIAPKLADLANETDTLIISLAQIARAKGGPATPLLDSRVAKGSSAIEESASVLFGLWRPYYNTGDDKYIRIAALKTRMGKEFVQALHWNGLTGDIRELTSDEAFVLDNLDATQEEESGSKYD